MLINSAAQKTSERIEVTYFQRKRRISSYSLEFLFDSVRSALSEKVDSKIHVAPFFSNGILRRIGILVASKLHEGAINHITGDNNFMGILLRRRSTILTVLDVGDVKTRKGFRAGILKYFWYQLPVKRAARITTISEASKQDIIDITNCDASRITVIPVPISSTYIYSPKYELAQPPRILQVGTSPNKNLERVVEALSGLDCVLVIIGELTKGQKQKLAEHSIQYKNFVGLSTEQLFVEYQNADMVTFVSLYEGFGMPIVESQRVGRPVITSNVASMPEVAGPGACLVDPTSVSSIRGAVVRLMADEDYRTDLILKGRLNAERFDISSISEQYLLLYKEVAQSKKGKVNE